MKKRRVAFIIGVFVIVGFFGFAALIIYIIPGYQFDMSRTYVMYFNRPLEGLQVGSKVEFRGIQVGKVFKIRIDYDKAHNKFFVPVFIHFIKSRSGKISDVGTVRALIKQGLRARLMPVGLLSSQSVIEIVFNPKSEPKFSRNITEFEQIPTIKGEDAIDTSAVLAEAKAAFKAIKDVAKSQKLKDMINSADLAFENGAKLLGTADKHVTPVSVNLNRALLKLQHAAYSVRVLADYLQRQPSSIIVGKGSPKRHGYR